MHGLLKHNDRIIHDIWLKIGLPNWMSSMGIADSIQNSIKDVAILIGFWKSMSFFC